MDAQKKRSFCLLNRFSHLADYFIHIAQYIRVKRKNQTIFLYADASEKVADLKGKLAKINEKSADELALIFNDAKLDNDKTVGDYKIENDQVVYLVYKKDGSEEFEEVDIQKPKPAEESEPKE